MRLDKFLAECSGNTRSEVKKWLKAGAKKEIRGHGYTVMA